ncbi:MAG: Nif3-like dinuclear metal center hexameric protein [Bacteroidales bacterium]
MKSLLIKEVTNCIENKAPLMLQESYDNAGLIIGDPNQNIHKILICVDVTEEVLKEAIQNSCDLIISHHPLIFSGLKKLNNQNITQRIVSKAIKNNIAIYAAHTNLDNVIHGVNGILAQKLGLTKNKILSPKKGLLQKLVTFVPIEYLEKMQDTLAKAGAGTIGNYDSCSFTVKGTGSFRASSECKPFVGEQGKLHREEEIRLETIFPKWKRSTIINELIKNHPYEEVAYDIYDVDLSHPSIGSGIIGFLPEQENVKLFLNKVKDISGCSIIRHSTLNKDKIQKVAICGGSGSFLISDAIRSDADIFITGDVKYHDFFEADNKIIIADIGHYESEQFSVELLSSYIKEKFPTFAVRLSEVNTNSIKYL